MDHQKGLVLVFTGNGKGKTTAALGLALRSWGYEMKVLILQFIKSQQCGEHLAAERMPGLEIRPLGLGFINFNDQNDIERQKQSAKEVLNEVETALHSGKYQLLILDEVIYALNYGLVELADVIKIIKNKPNSLHLVLTGRDAPQEIIDQADLVTEMLEIKHPYKKGIPAQKGIEY